MAVLKILKKGKKIKKVIKLLIIFLFIFISTLLIYKFKVKSIPINSQSIDKLNIVTEKNIINEIKNTNKIIPLEVELSKVITIDKSWGDFEVFQKYKRIKFFANCSYSIDLSNLKDEDIHIDDKNNNIDITIPNPEVFSINIIRDKTIYEDSSNGLLRFGEIKLTSEEFDLIQEEVYKSFNETLKDKEIYDKAISSSKISLTNLIKQIVNTDVEVNIYFK